MPVKQRSEVSTDLHKGNRQTQWAPNDINWVSLKQPL
uniref:Uncharacterized protein n=1 Tax=Anguilla anguilla TaxID=7936 RepID=A0A0E9RMM3_ANGAN